MVYWERKKKKLIADDVQNGCADSSLLHETNRMNIIQSGENNIIQKPIRRKQYVIT